MQFPDLGITLLPSEVDAIREGSLGRVRLRKQYPGLTNDACRRIISAVRVARAIEDMGGSPSDRTYEESGNEASVEVRTTRNVKTLDDLYEVTQVDREVWEAKTWKAKAYQGFSKDNEGNPSVTQMFSVSANFVRRVFQNELKELFKGLLEDLKKKAPIVTRFAPGEPEGHLVVMDLPDVHLGKLAWEMETGKSYSVEEAERLFTWATEDLLAKVATLRPEKIVFGFNGDTLHTDGSRRTTTGGTPQDTDGPWKDTFRRSVRMIRSAAERAAEIAPVELYVLEGNHDRDTAFFLSEVLQATYAGHGSIWVDPSAMARRYIRHGNNLIGMTHGSEEKPLSLPAIMSVERRQDWAETTWQEFHHGHLHHRKSSFVRAYDEERGVIIRLCPSLSAPDLWHYLKGFVASIRGAEAFVYRKAGGVAAHFCADVISG
jgi:hypothetical protein